MNRLLLLCALITVSACKHICPEPTDQYASIELGPNSSADDVIINQKAGGVRAACLATPQGNFWVMNAWGQRGAIPTNYVDLVNEGNNIEGRAAGPTGEMRRIKAASYQECTERLQERAALLAQNGLAIFPPFPTCTVACDGSCRE